MPVALRGPPTSMCGVAEASMGRGFHYCLDNSKLITISDFNPSDGDCDPGGQKLTLTVTGMFYMRVNSTSQLVVEACLGGFALGICTLFSHYELE